MNKKSGIALIIIGIMILSGTIYSQLIQKETSLPERNSNEKQESLSSELSDEGLYSSSFDNLSSVIKYEFSEDIAKQLDPVAFDKAFVTFLEEEKIITTSSDEDNPIGIYTVKDEGTAEYDFNDGTMTFGMTLLITGKPYFECNVGSDGSYDFVAEDIDDLTLNE